MRYGYIGKINSAKEFQEHIRMFECSGVPLDNVAVNLSFDEFIAPLNDGDTVVVCSYIGLFPSLSAYLTKAIEMLERGVIIESLQEPNLTVNTSNNQLICELNALNHRLRSASSIKSFSKQKEDGKKVGRPRGSSLELKKKVAHIDNLRKESNISVVAACKQVGCNLKTYYRLKDKISDGN